MSINRICICGGGNLAHVVGGYLASRHDCEVRLLTRHPDRWQSDGSIELTDINGKTIHSCFSLITSDTSVALAQTDIVLLCLPGFAIAQVLESLSEHITPQTLVGSVVSSTGFFLIADKLLPKGTKLFGFQRVPFIARTTEYGKSAKLLGYKPSLTFATENIPDPENLSKRLSLLFDIPAFWLDNYLKVTFTNSNPLLHPSRLYGMFHSMKTEYDHRILFYEEWDDLSSRTLIDCDREFGLLMKKLGIDGDIPSILEYYESQDAQSLTAKLRSIKAFKGIYAPMTETTDGKYKPDYQNRYFTEDIPYGLLLIKVFAQKNDVLTPTIDKVLEWAQTVMGKKYLINGMLTGEDLKNSIAWYIK